MVKLIDEPHPLLADGTNARVTERPGTHNGETSTQCSGALARSTNQSNDA